MPQLKKQFCKRGHDKDIVGRDPYGRCRVCERIRRSARYAKNLEVNRAKSRERARLDRQCIKEAIAKEQARIRHKMLIFFLVYGRIWL